MSNVRQRLGRWTEDWLEQDYDEAFLPTRPNRKIDPSATRCTRHNREEKPKNQSGVNLVSDGLVSVILVSFSETTSYLLIN